MLSALVGMSADTFPRAIFSCDFLLSYTRARGVSVELATINIFFRGHWNEKRQGNKFRDNIVGVSDTVLCCSSFRILLLFPRCPIFSPLPLRFYFSPRFASTFVYRFVSLPPLLHFPFLFLPPRFIPPILLFPVARLDLLSHSSFPYSGDDDLPIATKRETRVLAWQFSRSLVACNAFIHTVVEFSAIHCFPRYSIVVFESSFPSESLYGRLIGIKESDISLSLFHYCPPCIRQINQLQKSFLRKSILSEYIL